ncbi:hypothetical protein LVJ85_05545 [Neisseria sp. Dent CA1/247]|uniref:hypothetical protein n=1 Tax=Neisseria sp. Dent CA1/247 TaxID=2912675 RepID=UPI001FD3C5C4|nr:hypothetical protein [Neisseria sp. Dent CA1/247]UOO77925.1 hypothetical protein LVJ85_05545 [Neisseria sp. Dent CA1/247]
MALKTKTITIENGRDAGKQFIITEMPAAKIDNWAMRVLLALAGAGIDVAEANQGMMGLARVAFAALGKIPHDVALPLLDELLDCVQIIPQGGRPRPLDLVSLNDVEDFANLWMFRKEVFNLHIDFLQQGNGLN